MFYLLFRPPKKDSENNSQSSSSGKTPQNYVRRVLKMDPNEVDRIKKEIWQKQQGERLRQTSTEPEIKKLSEDGKQSLRFMLYTSPLALLAACATMWGIITCNSGAPISPVAKVALIVAGIFFGSLLFLLYTVLFGGIALMVYSMIYQPWKFIKIPEDKLPPLDDSEDNQDH